MINKIKCELYKIKKINTVKVLYFISILYIILICMQKAINKYSGFYNENLIYPSYMSSFSLVLFDSISSILMVCIGVFLADIEYKNDTWFLVLNNNKRYKVFLNKIVSLLVISFIIVISVFILGIIIGCTKGVFIKDISLVLSLKQLLIITWFAWVYSIFGFLLTLLIKNSTVSIIISILFFNFQSTISSIIPFFEKISFTRAQSSLLGNLFINLSNDQQLIIIENSSDILSNTLMLILYTVVFIIITIFIGCKKEIS